MDWNNDSILFPMWIANKRYTYTNWIMAEYELLCGDSMGVNSLLDKEEMITIRGWI